MYVLSNNKTGILFCCVIIKKNHPNIEVYSWQLITIIFITTPSCSPTHHNLITSKKLQGSLESTALLREFRDKSAFYVLIELIKGSMAFLIPKSMR